MRLIGCGSLLLVVAAACGGSSPAAPDAPPPLMGLGEVCNPTAAKPCANANLGCLSFASNPNSGICSALCVDGGTIMTDGTGKPTFTPDPTTGQPAQVCGALYTGSIGSGACTAVVAYMPMDNPLLVNMTYTAVQIACTVQCDSTTHACPNPLKCNTSLNRCEP